MKKKLLITLSFVLCFMIAFSAGIYAATNYTLVVNGKKVNADIKVINGTTYLPLRAIGTLLGAKVDYNASTHTITVNTASNQSTPANTPNSITIDNFTVKIDKVVQDSHSLRIYVTYTNNTNKEVSLFIPLSRIVAAGKQYDFDVKLNVESIVDLDIDNPSTLDPGASAQAIIFFEPVHGVEKINILLRANLEDYRFNNVPVEIY